MNRLCDGLSQRSCSRSLARIIRCARCNKIIKKGDERIPDPLMPDRFMHSMCWYVVMDVSFRAVGK